MVYLIYPRLPVGLDIRSTNFKAKYKQNLINRLKVRNLRIVAVNEPGAGLRKFLGVLGFSWRAKLTKSPGCLNTPPGGDLEKIFRGFHCIFVIAIFV